MSALMPIICYIGTRYQCPTCHSLFEAKADAIACCSPIDAEQVSVVSCPVCGAVSENTDFCCKPDKIRRVIEVGDRHGWSEHTMARLRVALKRSKELDWDNITVKYSE